MSEPLQRLSVDEHGYLPDPNGPYVLAAEAEAHEAAAVAAARAEGIAAIRGFLASLMFCENGGDNHDLMDRMRVSIGLPRLEGGYLDGWTDADMRSVGLDPEDD